jgi:hypothetical protein
MAKFNLENYETVEDRLKAYWSDNPEGRISTEVVHETADGTCVTIKAEIYIKNTDVHPVSTGIAQETKGQGGFANTDAWVENCETSAIGRALANWNYQGSKSPRPSRQEMSKVGNKPADVKVDKPKMTKDKEDIEVLEKAKKDFAESITDKPVKKTPVKKAEGTNAKQLNSVISGYELPEDVVNVYKATAFKQSGLSNDVESWSNDDMSKFLDLFEEQTKKEVSPVEEVFGEVTDISKYCPDCGKTEYIEDNREKKQTDSKFANIPSWTCSNYKEKNGCGWKAWGDTDCPTEWL